ncbi:class I SAM-dependent methyltransferase [Rhizobium laguerreae]
MATMRQFRTCRSCASLPFEIENVLRHDGCPMAEPIYAGASEGYDELFARATQLFIPSLLRAAHIESGQTVLDVATGTGAAARAAMDVVGSSGSVIAGDASPTMLEAARRNLKELPVRLEILDGQELPYPDNRFDAVICQLGLMFFNDPARGLSEFYRVLRNGRWAAVSVTTTAERSLFARIGAVIARHAPEKAEKLNRFFSIPTTERLRSLMGGAGFREVEIQTESREIEFASFDGYFSGIEKGATLSGQEFVQLSPSVQRRVRDEVRDSLGVPDDGRRLVIEMEVLIGSGRRQSG